MIVHSNWNCNEYGSNGQFVDVYGFYYPGIGDLRTIGQNDAYLSFVCNHPPGSPSGGEK